MLKNWPVFDRLPAVDFLSICRYSLSFRYVVHINKNKGALRFTNRYFNILLCRQAASILLGDYQRPIP